MEVNDMNEIAVVQTTLPIDIERGAAIARQLRDYLRQARMTVRIQGRDHVRIEGWQVLCHMCQLPLPSIVSLHREERADGHYVYVAEASLAYNGREYRAYGVCSSDEVNWRSKPEFQLASMAQTRAAGKVLRLLLGWVMTLAGYEPTPAEETYEPTPQPSPQRRVPESESMPEPEHQPEPEPQPEQPAPTNGANGDLLLRDLRAQNPVRYRQIIARLQLRARQVFGEDEARRREYLQQEYGVSSFTELTVQKAQEVYNKLGDMLPKEA
jgi:hypothetical protein